MLFFHVHVYMFKNVGSYLCIIQYMVYVYMVNVVTILLLSFDFRCLYNLPCPPADTCDQSHYHMQSGT